MVSSAVTGMVQPVTKVAGSVGSQSGQDNSGNFDFARIMNSSARNDVTGNSSKQTNTYSAASSDSPGWCRTAVTPAPAVGRPGRCSR